MNSSGEYGIWEKSGNRKLERGLASVPFPNRSISPVELAKLISIFLFSCENESVAESDCLKMLCKIQWFDLSSFPFGLVFLILSGKTD